MGYKTFDEFVAVVINALSNFTEAFIVDCCGSVAQIFVFLYCAKCNQLYGMLSFWVIPHIKDKTWCNIQNGILKCIFCTKALHSWGNCFVSLYYIMIRLRLDGKSRILKNFLKDTSFL